MPRASPDFLPRLLDTCGSRENLESFSESVAELQQPYKRGPKRGTAQIIHSNSHPTVQPTSSTSHTHTPPFPTDMSTAPTVEAIKAYDQVIKHYGLSAKSLVELAQQLNIPLDGYRYQSEGKGSGKKRKPEPNEKRSEISKRVVASQPRDAKGRLLPKNKTQALEPPKPEVKEPEVKIVIEIKVTP